MTEENQVEDQIETVEEAEEVTEEAPEVSEDEVEEAEEAESTEEDASEEEAFEVVLDAEEDADESPVIRQMREQNRQLKRELREARANKQKQVDELGPKPALSDFNFDEEQHEAALFAWHKQRETIEAQREEEQKAIEEFQADLARKRQRYDDAKAALNVPNFDDVEATVREALPESHFNVIIGNAKQPEILTLALAKNPKQLEKLAGEKDPVKVIWTLAQLEKSMTVKGKVKPTPETKLAGKTSVPVSSDKKLQQLEAEARRSGDRSKVIAHKKAMKKAAS